MKNIQLCHMDPVNRAEGKFSVTVHSEDCNVFATFACSSEHDARQLRDAIRDHADRLRSQEWVERAMSLADQYAADSCTRQAAEHAPIARAALHAHLTGETK